MKKIGYASKVTNTIRQMKKLSEEAEAISQVLVYYLNGIKPRPG